MKVIFGITIAALLLSATPARADTLSDVQEGVLYGAGGVMLLQHVLGKTGLNRPRYDDAQYGPYPQYGAHYGTADPVQRAFEAGLRERRQAELQERASRAYNCGRYGTDCGY